MKKKAKPKPPPKPKYPTAIIPRHYYSSTLDIDKFSKFDDYFVVRRSHEVLEETFNLDTNVLREGIIATKDVPGLSMNILGGRFHLHHLKYRCFGKAMDPWSKGQPKLKSYRNDIGKLKNVTPVFFPLGAIHNRIYPYYRSMQDAETKKIVESFELDPVIDKENDSVKLSGKAFVKHTPNKLNYWHVELELKDIKDEVIIQAKSAWAKSAASHSYMQLIVINALKEIKRHRKFQPDEYLKA